MMQPSNPPSLTPVLSNVDVVENLTSHEPAPYTVSSTTRRKACGQGATNAGKGSGVASGPFRNFRDINKDDDTTCHPH